MKPQSTSLSSSCLLRAGSSISLGQMDVTVDCVASSVNNQMTMRSVLTALHF